MRRLPPDWARILADVDHDRRAAIVALGPGGELAGGCAIQRARGPGRGGDRWACKMRGGGGAGDDPPVGASRACREPRITRFLAYVLADNHRMMRFIGRVGRVTERSVSGGEASLRFTRRPDSGLPEGPVAEGRS
jgi:hypothetical protein